MTASTGVRSTPMTPSTSRPETMITSAPHFRSDWSAWRVAGGTRAFCRGQSTSGARVPSRIEKQDGPVHDGEAAEFLVGLTERPYHFLRLSRSTSAKMDSIQSKTVLVSSRRRIRTRRRSRSSGRRRECRVDGFRNGARIVMG